MKLFFAAVLLTATGFDPLLGQEPANPPLSKAEEDVRKLEREWLDAYERFDASAMDRIVAQDFAITFPDGYTQDKPQLMASIQAPRKPGQPSPRFFTEGVRSRAYGDTVILTGTVVTEVQRDGKPVQERSLYTDTYVKRDGRWQVVASHLSNVTEAKPASSDPSAVRWVRGGNTIVSPKVSPIQITVDRQLSHIGALTFPLRDVAEVERFVFARSDDGGRIQAMVIAQFESILPGVKGEYTFEITNATRLGGHDYETSVGLFHFAQAAAANPGAEAEHTQKFLAKHRLTVEDDYLVARYARVTDTTKRHEMILFYYESLRDLGVTRAEIGRGGAKTEGVFRDFAARAVGALEVTDGD